MLKSVGALMCLAAVCAERRRPWLGWVLHAIGDTFCPQHTIGSLGWSHQPWERFANVRWVDQQVFLEDDVVQHYPNMVSELTYAFGYWNASNQGSQADWVGRMVQQLAIETAGSPFAVQDRAFKGTISVESGSRHRRLRQRRHRCL